MHGSSGGTNTSCYIRIPFTLDPESLPKMKSLELEVMYDDGFVAFLNEEKIAEQNAPAIVSWNSNSASSGEAGAAIAIDVSSHIQNLVAGDNLLAIHGLNWSLTSSDFLIMAKLSGDSSFTAPGNINKNAVEYSSPLSIDQFYVIKTRVFYNNEWSALNEIKVNNQSGLIISELNYHPMENPPGGQLEFIELKNIAGEVIDLGTCAFSDGVSYRFPIGTEIEPGEFIVLASDRTVFENEYGFKPFDEFTGALDNQGERITITRDSTEVIYDLQYDDEPPWPECADGRGGTLVPVSPDTKADYQQAAYWRCSAQYNGSPGEDDPDITNIPEGNDINEFQVGQNYPNPFSDHTYIIYTIPYRSKVRVEVYSVMGQKIAVISDEMKEAGKHITAWNGTGQDGRQVPDGLYFCRISFNGITRFITLVSAK
jgi:hypothetical protein